MPGDEVTLDEIYAEVDKRIKTALDAAKVEWAAELAKKQDAKKPFSIKRQAS
jgi:hypothetical protein